MTLARLHQGIKKTEKFRIKRYEIAGYFGPKLYTMHADKFHYR